MYAFLENAIFILVAIWGLLIALFPGKFLKPSLRESATGRIIGRIIGVILLIGGVFLFIFFMK